MRDGYGAAISVRDGHMDALLELHDELYEFRMIPIRSHGAESFPNLDYEDRELPVPGDYLCIQSGAKMWCGYDRFCTEVATIAEHLEDATFYIADEEDFVDRFRIVDGGLQYERCHSGYWYGLEDYLRDNCIG